MGEVEVLTAPLLIGEATQPIISLVIVLMVGYEMLDKEKAIPVRVALEDARSRSRPELAKHGAQSGNQNAAKDRNEGDIVTFVSESERGNKTSYLTDRLRTQYPEIFAGLERGAYRSIHEAAVKAGILKPMTQHTITVQSYLRSIQKYLSQDETSQGPPKTLRGLLPP